MGQRRFDELGSLQQQVIEALWSLCEATVHDVRASISAPDADADDAPAYTTVLSVLQKLEKSGWVQHRKEGRSHVYAAAVSRSQAGARSVRSVLDRVFGGDPRLLFQQLIDDDRIDPADLDAMRSMLADRIDDAEGGNGHG